MSHSFTRRREAPTLIAGDLARHFVVQPIWSIPSMLISLNPYLSLETYAVHPWNFMCAGAKYLCSHLYMHPSMHPWNHRCGNQANHQPTMRPLKWRSSMAYRRPTAPALLQPASCCRSALRFRPVLLAAVRMRADNAVFSRRQLRPHLSSRDYATDCGCAEGDKKCRGHGTALKKSTLS